MIRTLAPGFDQNVLTAPFGVMFCDRLDQRAIAAGLEVSLSDPQRPGSSAQRLTANREGIFVAHAVRGLRRADNPATLLSPAATRRFDLQVTDTLGRYVPLRLSAALPSAGLFEPACMIFSPVSAALPHVPLYSAVSRDIPAGMGVVRADLRLASDPDAGAAWARLELWLDDALIAEGVADQRGSALLLCPLPAPRDPPLHSSPAGVPGVRSWDVRLRAFWSAQLADDPVPDLCELQQFPEVSLLQSVSPATLLGPTVLRAGSPLIIRSAGSSFVFVSA
ncbi:hypothetical protein CBA19CS11_29460 [Caballeronia novacaledonica]|uniref:hypothetical protein n=1 Tax=Caballeronia novacaledonica TaxID=1544861 RepID=UPI001EE1C93C|nr:hypothetical protein [Caballeronia novacaledonica]GJH13052.1 hypothetical protein CBA19CS11_29460 [Caballeronia novacaledonica]